MLSRRSESNCERCDRIVAKEEEMALNVVKVRRNKAGKFVCYPKTVEVSIERGDSVAWECKDAAITRIAWGKEKGNPFPGPPVGSGGVWVAVGPPNKPADKDPYPYDLTVNVDGRDETADPDVEVVP
jgi:hypothetical protein